MALTETITYDSVENMVANIEFNYRTIEPTGELDEEGRAITVDRYYPARVTLVMDGVPTNGVRSINRVSKEILVGTPKLRPLTLQEVFSFIKSTAGLPALSPIIKDSLVEAVNVKVS